MAITFEDEETEEKKPIGSYLAGFLLLIAAGAGIFFVVNYFLAGGPNAREVTPTENIQLNTAILSDSRLDSLVLLPEVVLGSEPIGRNNPFKPLTDQEKKVIQDQVEKAKANPQATASPPSTQ